MKDFSKLGPPWILFSDDGKPVAILPAGRPGEIANVEGWPIETVSAIIQAANAPVRRTIEEAMLGLATKMEAMGCKMPAEAIEEVAPEGSILAELKRYRAKEAAELAFLKRSPADIHESQQLRYFSQVWEKIERELDTNERVG